MSLRDLLEPFDNSLVQSGDPAGASVDIEAEKKAAFEAGYASGWEDAKQAELSARQHVEAEFERNIQNLAFTYHEAVDRIRGELAGFVTAFVDTFLPGILPDVLKETLRGELTSMADTCLDGPVELVSAPDCHSLLEDMLDRADIALDVKLIADADLSMHQVFVRVGEREQEIDFQPLIDALQDQVAALTTQDKETQANGWT